MLIIPAIIRVLFEALFPLSDSLRPACSVMVAVDAAVVVRVVDGEVASLAVALIRAGIGALKTAGRENTAPVTGGFVAAVVVGLALGV